MILSQETLDLALTVRRAADLPVSNPSSENYWVASSVQNSVCRSAWRMSETMPATFCGAMYTSCRTFPVAARRSPLRWKLTVLGGSVVGMGREPSASGKDVR